MLRYSIGEVIEPFYGVALRTIRRDSVPGKLAIMIIPVAICAPVMLQGISGFAFVTIIAPDCLMLLLKFEICFIMIKPG